MTQDPQHNGSDIDMQRLVTTVSRLMEEKGLKAMTMDLVARRLGMSKRTLYEIFDSKDTMVKEVFRYIHSRHVEFCRKTFAESPDMMEAMATIVAHHISNMGQVSINFFRDMDRCRSMLRSHYEDMQHKRHEELLKMCRTGVEQGVFRKDVNYPVLLRMMEVQMESLKRMEDLFPPDITIGEVYSTIMTGFLRSIASRKGMKILDTLEERGRGKTVGGRPSARQKDTIETE